VRIRFFVKRLTRAQSESSRNLAENKDMNMNNINIKKIVTIITLATTFFVQSGGYVLAQEINIPTPPPIPTAPPAPIAPPLPSSPPLNPTLPSLPTLLPTLAPTPDPTPTPQPSSPSPEQANQSSYSPQPEAQTDNQSSDGGNGSSITTGDATNSGAVVTDANENISVTPGDSGSGISVVNEGNGSDSENDGSVSVVDNNLINQDNSVNVGNNLNLITTTGNNSSSANTGGNSEIITGNANTSGTIITAVNTNIGVAVSEFNIVDDQVGDIILDFAASCISGCLSGQNASVLNSGNGDSSQNLGEIDSQSNNQTFQNNDATVENNMYLSSNSGDNNANRNTGGDSNILTGDANVEANVLTFANNNFAGGVYYGVVNIYGDLVGDIVLSEATLASLGLLNASNIGNGADSVNTASADSTTNNTLLQTNNIVIDNNLIFDANTGENDVSRNTDGASSVESGNANLTAQVLNVANSNVTGGNWWLVIVNQAGQWIGKILGASEGSNFAEFVVGPNGEITAVNSGNGSQSTNNASVTTNQNNQTTQTNTANIVNNVNLSANTGDNSASRNTGGNSSIVTGDANIIANIVNFVNNNISGSGNLIVTVVNVFGSWLGDFIAPGQTKQNNNVGQNNELAIGGVQTTNSNNSNTDSTAENIVAVNTPLVSSSSKNIIKLASLGTIAQNFSDVPAPETLAVTTQAYQTQNTATDKSLKINLAWILLIIPAVLIFAVLPRKGRHEA